MFKRKTALITGSTSGIGLGIAEYLAKAGVRIVLNGMGDADQIEATRARIAATYGVEVLFQGANMHRPDAIEAMFQTVADTFGGVDILVNNAGIQHVAPTDEFPVDKWDAIIAINLTASFHTICHALAGMKQKQWGRIIQIASAHALIASPYKSAYVADKHGIAGLTKTVALEVAEQGVTANAICPGYAWTPLEEKQVLETAKARGISEDEVIQKVLLAALPTKKFVTIEQVAAFAGFLASDAASSITGAVLPADGGWTAH